MATVNDVTNQMNADGQYTQDDELMLNTLDELYQEYRNTPTTKSFADWLMHNKEMPLGRYNGYLKESLVATARTHADKFKANNGITNGNKTLTVESSPGDSTNVTERSNRDLPAEEGTSTITEGAPPAETPLATETNTAKTPADVDTAIDKINEAENFTPQSSPTTEPIEEEKTSPSSVGEIAQEMDSEAEQEPGDTGVITGKSANTADNETPVREEEEDVNRYEGGDTSTETQATPQQQQQPVSPQVTTKSAAPLRTQPAENLARSGIYNTEQAPAIRPVDRGRFDYIRNNGWGSNSSILTRMGYSQDEIRRILDSSGAVRPEYFSY